MQNNNNIKKVSDLSGLFFLLPAFLIWGLSPIYWKALAHVSPIELLLQRVIWSFVLLIAIVIYQGKTHEIIKILKSKSTFMSLVGSSIILSFNWYLFIWAVNNDLVLQTSLGYYINPLIMVLLGIIFLGERLRKFQLIALLIALMGVLYYAIGLGEFPWVALGIAFSFGFYGLFHKMTSVGALTGLCVESMILSVPGAVYLIWLYINGTGAMFRIGFSTDILLVGTNLVTALPLLLFTLGAKRTSMSTIGFVQYFAPSISFALAVLLYQEPFSHEKLVIFIAIWSALLLYTVDSLHAFKYAIKRCKTR